MIDAGNESQKQDKKATKPCPAAAGIKCPFDAAEWCNKKAHFDLCWAKVRDGNKLWG